MSCHFDPEKARLNLAKHGVSFADAEPVFYDPMALTTEDNDAVGEFRLVTMGMDALGRVLVVVYTQRGEQTRIISARKASAGERKKYDAQ